MKIHISISRLLGILLMLIAEVNAQNIPNRSEITFLGIDFTQVKLLGFDEDSWGTKESPEKIVSQYFREINQKFMRIDSREVGHNFKTNLCTVDVAFFQDLNAKINPNTLFQKESNIPNKDAIENLVRGYRFNNLKTPYAFFLVATELNRNSAYGGYYVVLYVRDEDKFYVSNEDADKASGFGFVNFWFGTAWEAMERTSEKNREWFFHRKPIKPRPEFDPRRPGSHPIRK